MRGRTPVFSWALAGTLALALLATLGVMKQYWGYYLKPPSLDARIAGAKRVVSLTPVSTKERDDGTRAFVTDPDYFIVKCGDTSPGGYYELEERVIHALQKRGTLSGTLEPLHPKALGTADDVFEAFKWTLDPHQPRMEEEGIAALYSFIEDTGLVHPGTPGYESARMLSGIVIEAEHDEGGNVLLIAVAGGQVSNDHYPYYEFLFAMPDGGGKPRLLSCKRWFYDNEGKEFLTLPFLLVAFSIPAVIVAILITVVVRGGRSKG